MVGITTKRLARVAQALCCVAVLATPTARADAAGGAALFSADRLDAPAVQRQLSAGAAIAPALALDERRSPGAVRQRGAVMDVERLAALRLDVQRRRTAPIRLNLFADASLAAVFQRAERTASGYTLAGHLEGRPHSTVVFAVNGDVMAGMVWAPGVVYSIDALGDAAVIREASSAAFGECLAGMQADQEPNRATPRWQHQPLPLHSETPADDGSVIDVLVVYPSVVRRSQGGHRFMRTLIERDVALANEAYRASGATQRLNLVAAVEVEYKEAEREASAFRLFDHLNNPSSGYMDEVHALRDAYAADLVVQHWGDLTGSGVLVGAVAGIANQMTELSAQAEAPFGFSIANSFAFAHELGHNMGLRHDRGRDVGNTPFPYSHGYVVNDPTPALDGLHTIMAYGSAGKRILRFSNPNHRYPDAEGAVIGVHGDQPSDSADGPAHAARSLNETRRVVANFRASANRCAYALSQSPTDLPATGGKYRVRVDTARHCAWTARTNDPFVTIAAGTGGTGSGELTYTVAANRGWEREVAVLVAGEVHLAKQAGARTVESVAVCERPTAVRDALVRSLNKPCADITLEDMASVRQLGIPVRPDDDEHPWAGAFLGLANLLELDMGYVTMSTLPIDTFDGLPNLYKLNLGGPNLKTIQSGAFNGLGNLYELDLDESGLSSLQPGAFLGLHNLWNLNLTWTQLTTLHEGGFSGLSGLRDLIIAVSPMVRVEAGAFRGLSSLDYLVFNKTSITTLPANTFAGLDRLEHLYIRYHNRLRTLPRGVFNGLPRLAGLDIHQNALTALPSGLFSELPSLSHLSVFDNDKLTTAEVGAFDGLDSLEGLLLADNDLTVLDSGVLRGLSNLSWLDANRNRISDISGLSTLTNLRQAYLAVNFVSDVSPLVENIGLGHGDYVRLDGNPWSDESRSSHIPALRQRGVDVRDNHVIHLSDDRVEAKEGEPLVFAVGLRPARTSDTTVAWRVHDLRSTFGPEPGVDYPAKQNGTITIAAGETNGSFAVRTFDDDEVEDDEAFTVRLLPPPGGLPDGLLIEPQFGEATILDDDPPDNQAPRTISLLPDIYTTAGVRTTLSVAGRFDDPDGDTLAISVMSSSPAVAVAASRRELSIEALEPGLAAVVVTATDPDGDSAALTFAVRVSTRRTVVRADDRLDVAADDTLRIDLLASFRELIGGALIFMAESSDPTVAAAAVRGTWATIEPRSQGSTRIVVTMTDAAGLSRTLAFSVTVGDAVRLRRGQPPWRMALARDGAEGNRGR